MSLILVKAITEPVNKSDITNFFDGEDCIIKCAGSLDDCWAGWFSDRLAAATSTSRHIYIDFTSARFVDALILQELLGAWKTMQQLHGYLHVVVADDSHAARVFHTTGLDQILDIEVRAIKFNDIELELHVFSRWMD